MKGPDARDVGGGGDDASRTLQARGAKPSACGGACVAASQGCVQDFGDATTLHGIRYITQPESHLLERLCWILAVCASALFCGFEIAKLWDRWQSSPVITSFAETATRVTSVPFPAVTICPESKLRTHVLDVDNNLLSIVQQLEGVQPYNSTEQKTLFEAASLICSPLPSYGFKPTLEHRRLIFEMAPSIDDVFENCELNLQPHDCSTIFRTVLTNVGVCFTFNMQGDHELFKSVRAWPPVKRGSGDEATNDTWDSVYILRNSTWDPEHGYAVGNEPLEFPYREETYLGPSSGLQVVLKTKSTDIQQLCTKSNAENVQVLLHTPTEFPSPLGNYFHMSPGSQAMVAVRPTTVTAEPQLRAGSYSPKDRGCVFPQEKDMFIFSTYTKQNCILDDILQYMWNNCSCMPFSFPLKGITFIHNKNLNNTTKPLYYIPEGGNKTFCSKNVEECRNSEPVSKKITGVFEKPVCLPSCFELNYGYTVSSAQHQETQLELKNPDMKYSKLIVFFEEESFNGKRKSELYGITDFIANCGGLLGLFTGFSLVSLVEVVYFAAVRLPYRLHRHRHRRLPLATNELDDL